MDYKYAIHPKHYNIGQIEKFYTEMAAKGWHLHKHGQTFSEFIKGEPKDMKYRVEVLNPKKAGWLTMSDEQKAVFEDCGWEYVDGISYISILRAPADSDTEEFYIDPAHQAETLQGLRSLVKHNISFIPTYFLSCCIVWFFRGINLTASAHLIWLESPFLIIGFVTGSLALISDSIIGTIRLNKLYKQMERGIPIDHSPKSNGRTYAITIYAVVALCAVMMLSPLIRPRQEYPQTSDSEFVTLADLGINAISNEDIRYIKSTGYSYRKSLFCDYWYVTMDITPDGEAKSIAEIEQQIFLLKNKKHIDKTIKSLMNTADFGKKEENFREMSVDGFDKVYIYSDKEIIIAKDNYVGIFASDFTETTKNILFKVLIEKWKQ